MAFSLKNEPMSLAKPHYAIKEMVKKLPFINGLTGQINGYKKNIPKSFEFMEALPIRKQKSVCIPTNYITAQKYLNGNKHLFLPC